MSVPAHGRPGQAGLRARFTFSAYLPGSPLRGELT
jgi:hypothetical protein